MRFFTILLFALVLNAACLSAQSGTASLHGTIADPSAGVVPNATITAASGQGPSRTVQSDEQGRYQLNGLPSGVYSVRVTSAGFLDWEQEKLPFKPGQVNRRLDLQMRFNF